MKKIFLILSLAMMCMAALAQEAAAVSPVQKELESIDIMKFKFGRLICDIHTAGSDILCETEMDKEEWDRRSTPFAGMYTKADMFAMPGVTKDNADYLCRRINEMTDKDSCFIYVMKGFDALKWIGLLQEKPAVSEFLKAGGGKIQSRVIDSATRQQLAEYDITLGDMNSVAAVKNEVSETAAKTLYLQCYSGIIGVRLSALTMPLTVDEYTVATGAEVRPGLISYTYDIDDQLFDDPSLPGGMKEIAAASLRPAMRLVRYIGYRIKYTYRGKQDKSKTFSFLLD